MTERRWTIAGLFGSSLGPRTAVTGGRELDRGWLQLRMRIPLSCRNDIRFLTIIILTCSSPDGKYGSGEIDRITSCEVGCP